MTSNIGNRSTGRPERGEAAEYYFGYIDRIESADIVDVLESQLAPTVAFLDRIGEEESLHRYAPGKWSMREVLNHVTDTERVFSFRALWFGRGFDSPLPSFDEALSAAAARSDQVSWADHVAEFRAVRRATLGFFRNLPSEAWMRVGMASGNSFSVRGLAYIIAGHLTHHLEVLDDRYLRK
jgi:uncharacterized damage-inducible protein DinB